MDNEIDIIRKSQQSGSITPSVLNVAQKHLTAEQWQDLGKTAAIKHMELEESAIRMLNQDAMAYKDLNNHINAMEDLNSQRMFDRHKMTSEIKTATGKMTIESRKGSACFVATATYRDENHPDVQYLRTFRDQYLLMCKFGIYSVKIYYKIGPYLARIVAQHDILRKISYACLTRFVKYLRNRYPAR